tara:strand:- start:384 stop:824 length:441 start_codon:yes stop_codon:yes gene_type:complete
MDIKVINNHFKDYKLNNTKIFELLHSISENENKFFSLVNIILEKDEYLRILKKKYFNQDMYTDVISFNLENPDDPIEGEVYISLPRIIENAHQYRDSLNNELKRIIIHGILHLIGYNDNTDLDKENMTSLENKYIKINPGEIIQYS